MINLKALIGEQKGTKWVEFKDGFELCLRYLPKQQVKRLNRVHPDKVEEETCRYVVVGWRGLTARKLYEICKVDRAVSEEEMDEEIPFTLENLKDLVDAVYDLDEFIESRITDFKLFQPENWGAQLKNSSSGGPGPTLHGKKPARAA